MSSLEGLSSAAQPDMKELLGSMLKDAFNPKGCERGMVIAPVQSSYPYPLISRDIDSGLDVPYLCDTLTDGGGWIIIQRRATGDTDFVRSWADYKQGFGPLEGDFWLGNDNIHTITSSGTWELRVDVVFRNEKAHALYTNFSVGDESDNYRLYFEDYNSTVSSLPDNLSYHKYNQFSTYDNDNDSNRRNCARMHHGGWWYNSCDTANLNSKWGAGNDHGIEWTDFTGPDSAEFSEMKIRRVE